MTPLFLKNSRIYDWIAVIITSLLFSYFGKKPMYYSIITFILSVILGVWIHFIYELKTPLNLWLFGY